jgi:hypothetical protein
MAREEIFFGINIDTGEAIKDFGTLKNRTKALKKELDGTKVGTKRFEELKKEITANQGTIRRFNRELRDTKSLATRVGQGVMNAFKGVGVAFAGAFALDKIIDFGKQVFDLSKDLGSLTNQFKQLTGASEESARALADQAKAIEQVFGVDTQETMRAANTVAKSFGITTEEALDKIQVGFAAGLNNSGEFLEILKEYPVLLKEVGLNADETFAIIDATVKDGVFSDKGIDAIKEAGIRLREFTPATEAALKGIGLNSVKIQNELKRGTKTVFDVIQDVSNKMSELPPQSAEVGTAIADIFGGPGEDAGLKFLTTLQDIDTSFTSITENLSDYEEAQLDLVKAQTKLNGLVNRYFGDSSEGFTKLKAGVLDYSANGLGKLLKGGVDLINQFITLYNETDAFRVALSAIGQVAKIPFDILKTQIKVITDAFNGLFRAIDLAVGGNFRDAINELALTGKKVANNVISAGKDVASNFKSGFESALNPREKIKLLDFSYASDSDESKQNSFNAGLVTGQEVGKGIITGISIETKKLIDSDAEIKKALKGINKQFDLDLTGNFEDSLKRIGGGLDKLKPKIKETKDNTFESLTMFQKTEMALWDLGNGLGQASQSFAQLAEIQAEGSAKQEKFAKASIRLSQLSALASQGAAFANILEGATAKLKAPFPANLAFVASTLAAGVGVFATVKSLTSPVKFQRGGVIEGKSHAEGGVPVKLANGGMVEAEGGEVIINKKSSALFSKELSAINSYGGYGDKFERGGLLGVPSTSPVGDTTNAQLLGALNNINFQPTVSVIEINEAQTRINEVNTSSQL